MYTLALLVTALPLILSSPLPDGTDTALTGDPYFDSCIQAPNCETYTDATGQSRIRFKDGMGPGSNDHTSRFRKRDGTPDLKTMVHVGNKKLLWGCGIDPAVELQHIEFACKDASCDNNDPFIRNVQYIDIEPKDNQYLTQTNPEDLSLQISSTGHFAPEKRDALIKAIVDTAKTKDLIHWIRDIKWTAWKPASRNDNTSPGDAHGGKCAFAEFSNYIGVTILRKGSDGTFAVDAFMDATISYPDKDKNKGGFCGQMSKIMGSVAATVGGAAGPASGIFGLIEASCS